MRFVHRDGAVILRDVLNAEQLTEINAELDGPMEALQSPSEKRHWSLRIRRKDVRRRLGRNG